MKRRAVLLTLVGTVAAVVALPAAASAAEADGCSGTFATYDTTGAELGSVDVPGDGGTQADPLPVDAKGTVVWSGTTDAAITNARWSVTVGGVRVGGGDFENAEGDTAYGGTEDLSGPLGPVAWALKGGMVIPVSGSITGDGGTCRASGWITGTGAATSSPLFFAGLGLGVVGILMGVGVLAGTKVVAGGAAAAGGAS
jgi:hypothetical protein